MKFKILFFLITFFYFNSLFADVLKPSVNIDPKQVVLIQLKALNQCPHGSWFGAGVPSRVPRQPPDQVTPFS